MKPSYITMSNTTKKTELINAVLVIKDAILQSQQRALVTINQELLALYYGIGRFVSANTRNKNWGKGFIEAVSEQLRKELPGLRGFSAASLRKMRTFYEEWHMLSNNSFVGTNKLANVESNSFVGTNDLATVQFKINADFPSANKKFVEYVIQDYDKPMGVAIYNTTADMDEKLKKLLPPVEELKKLM